MNPRQRCTATIAFAALIVSLLHSTHPAATAAPTAAEMLVITSATANNRYGPYLVEILRTEGWMGLSTADISTVSPALLADRPVVFLTEMTLTPAQRALITDYVNGGGRLIAMRPEPQLAPLFGLSAPSETQTAGYVKIDTTQQLGSQLPAQPLQLHTSSGHYPPSTARTVARLTAANGTPNGYPAVTTTTRTAAFAYDLASNVILTRQGNPANATYVNPVTHVVGDLDGDCIVRTIDLFQSEAIYADNVPNPNYNPNKPTTPENNPVKLNCVGGTRIPIAYGNQPWVDRNLIAVPQVDAQLRLLSRLIEQLSPYPLPRLWYHPDGKKTLLVLTGDAHANPLYADNPATPAYDPDTYYTLLINSVKARGGHFTTYMTKGGGIESSYGQAQIEAWQSEGQDFGIHPPVKKPDNFPTAITNLTEGYDDYVGSTATSGWWFGSAQQPGQKFSFAPSRTVRTHQVAWQGWTDAAEIEAAHGIALDANFYTWGPWMRQSDNTYPYGAVTGSNQAMQFVKADGTILPVYQQVTQLIDEELFETTPGYGEKLSATQGISVSKRLIDASQNGDYATLMTQFHIDYFNYGEIKAWAEATMDYAVSKGIPLWSAKQQLEFLEARNGTQFQNTNWNAATNQLTFTLVSGTSASTANLTLRLPITIAGHLLQRVTVDGTAASLNTQQINGQPTTLVTVAPGTRAITAEYLALTNRTLAPVIVR